MTSSTDLTNLFSQVKVSFGTGPDKTFSGSRDTPPSVPEPSTMALAALGGLGFLGYGLRRLLKK
jgi:hypothetical protein